MSTTTEPLVPTPRRRLRGSERRQRIEEAAVEVFATHGYDATTLGEIGTAAGVSRTVLYDHFTSKRMLYLHVLGTQNTAMLAGVSTGITGTGDPRSRLRDTVEAYLRFAREHPAARKLLVDPVPTGDEELEEVRHGYSDMRSQAVAVLLGPDLERAGVALDSPGVMVMIELLITGVDGVAQWWARNPAVPLGDVVEHAVRLLWNGLPRAGQP